MSTERSETVTVYWVEDYLSKDCIDGRYYMNKQEAVDRRNELGYGIVRWHHHENAE